MIEAWRSVGEDLPTWQDTGWIELRAQEGGSVRGWLSASDVGFDGEDEYPVFELTLADGSHPSLHDFSEWRPATEAA